MLHTGEEVTAGEIVVDVHVDTIIPIKLNLDLCEEAPQAGLKCPVAPGTYTVTTTQSTPPISVSQCSGWCIFSLYTLYIAPVEPREYP